ncbi:MAG TPA: hypothetical protein VNZ86_20095, partial [Bacteroidia bacterium]|nr:hypothetical protein [Bacteroidia bacterium]
MKKYVIAGAIAFATLTAFVIPQQNMKTEASEHPRIEKAIHEMEDAIAYMEKAPHDFGGHKADAIADTKKAIQSLKKALAYRAKEDNK